MNIDEELLRHFLSDVTNSWEIISAIADGDLKPEDIRPSAIRVEVLLKRTKEKLEEILSV